MNFAVKVMEDIFNRVKFMKQKSDNWNIILERRYKNDLHT